MSNFSTLAMVTEGNISTAPNRFVASTPDSYAQITALGYLNDIQHLLKANDILNINYLDASVFPLDTGESSLSVELKVAYSPGGSGHWSLVPANLNQAGMSLMESYGFHSAVQASTTTAATSVYNDAKIALSSLAFARWPVAATAGYPEKVLPGNGTLTVLNSATAGVSEIAYFSVIPSVALQGLGVYANQYSNPGGSATVTIADANIVVGQLVVANIQSSANAVKIETVAVAAGVLTMVLSGDPGVSVISYLAVVPSSALTADGLYAASSVSAGGSATVTITDANITVNSVVMAEMSAQTNASFIEKVTPGSGSLTILLNTDAGAATFSYLATQQSSAGNSSEYLLAVNNLSDVQSASTALANLGGLPLAGGQMTGQLLMDRGTATSTAGAATINHQVGVVTTEALTTAAASAYAFTLTNSRIATTSVVLLQLMGGTNTTRGIECRAIPGNGSATLSFFNNNVAASALNGTLIFGFQVL
jgi:hypothetical protein